MSRQYWMELIVGVTEQLAEKVDDARFSGNWGAVPGDLTRFFERAQGAGFMAGNGTNWTLGRVWHNVQKYVGDQGRAQWERDHNNSVYQWLDSLFTKYWTPADNGGDGLRPAAAFWYDDGMQVGTRYAFIPNNGHVMVDDPSAVPHYPYDYADVKRYMPLLNGDQNVVWDCQPEFRNAGQCLNSFSLVQDALRRWYQPDNSKLDAAAFGVQPWTPVA